jgi:hypothetical protein
VVVNREEQLHDVCFAMKKERLQGETHSRHLLAASIVAGRPVAQLVAEAMASSDSSSKRKKKPSKVRLSKKKPTLIEGVTYEDVFQWYNLCELQAFAREKGIRVSGKKKELIERVLAFLADPDSVIHAKPKKKKKKTNNKTNKATQATTEKKQGKAAVQPAPEEANFKPDPSAWLNLALALFAGCSVLLLIDTQHPARTTPELAALLEVITKRCKSAQKGLSAAEIDAAEAQQRKEVRIYAATMTPLPPFHGLDAARVTHVHKRTHKHTGWRTHSVPRCSAPAVHALQRLQHRRGAGRRSARNWCESVPARGHCGRAQGVAH